MLRGMMMRCRGLWMMLMLRGMMMRCRGGDNEGEGRLLPPPLARFVGEDRAQEPRIVACDPEDQDLLVLLRDGLRPLYYPTLR
jgi:hypothetical protein